MSSPRRPRILAHFGHQNSTSRVWIEYRPTSTHLRLVTYYRPREQAEAPTAATAS